MKRTRIALLVVLMAGLALVGPLATSHLAAAQAGGGYDLSWWTVGGGGGSLDGGGFVLTGTLGQAEATTWRGGGYTLSGGFWGGGEQVSAGAYRIYLPLVLRRLQ